MDGKPTRYDCPELAKGWIREVVVRKSGLSAGRVDVYYFSPCGKKFRSKPQIASFLGDDYDLTNFDYQSGSFRAGNDGDPEQRSRRTRKRKANQDLIFSRDFTCSMVVGSPIRQSTGTFSKQPVTHVPEIPDNDKEAQTLKKSKEKSTFKTTNNKGRQSPKQLFWEKRLQGLKPSDMDQQTIKDLRLPDGFRPVGPDWDEKALLQSLTASLHLSRGKVNIQGQYLSLNSLEKNPTVWLSPEQPLCAPFVVTDSDVKKQEECVRKARRRLAEALQELDHMKRFVAQHI